MADLARGTTDPERRRRERRGRWAEVFAALAVRINGWRVLAVRHRARGGEADIIAKRGSTIAIIEVKARRTEAEAIDAVGEHAWRRIEAAGDDWLMRHPYPNAAIRYDLVWVPTPLRPWRWPKRLAGAWEP